jgi:hypothetical protein
MPSHIYPVVIGFLNVMDETPNPELPVCVLVIRLTHPIQVTLQVHKSLL